MQWVHVLLPQELAEGNMDVSMDREHTALQEGLEP